MCRLIRGMALRSDQTKSPWEARDIPVDEPQGTAYPEKPRGLCTLPSFLGQGRRAPPLGFVPAVTHTMAVSMRGQRQGVERFWDPPRPPPRHMPLARLPQAAAPPRGEGRRGPAGALCPGVPPWVQGLHADQPTQDEAMAAFPDTGHPAQ